MGLSRCISPQLCLYRVLNILVCGTPLKIFNGIIGLITVFMINLGLILGVRNERPRYNSV